MIDKYENDLFIHLHLGSSNTGGPNGPVGVVTDDTRKAHTSSGEFLTWFRVDSTETGSTLGDHSDLRSSYLFNVPTVGGSSDISPLFSDLAYAYLRINRNDDVFQNQIPNVSSILKSQII